MTEETRTDLRQADASISVEGILSEKKLEKVPNPKGSGNVIRGNLVVKTSPVNFITLNVYVSEFNNNGDSSRAYSGMETVMEQYESIAEVGEDLATKLRCNKGNLQPNTYIDKTDLSPRTRTRYSASFVSRVQGDTFDPHATFEVEGYINTVTEEVDQNGEPTGRLKVMLYVPTYQGVEPMDVIVPQDIADEFNSIFEPGQTTKFYGYLSNNIITENKTIALALGGSRVEKHTTYINEIIVTGATEPYEEEREFSRDAINKGLVERDLRLQQEVEKAKVDKKPTIAPAKGPASGVSRPFPKFNM